MTDEIRHVDVPAPPSAPPKGSGRKPLKAKIPQLPRLDVDVAKLPTPTQRSVACVNLRLDGVPFFKIAELLDYADAAAAKAAYIAALSSTHAPEDWDTLRQSEVMRAEQQWARSSAMAQADYLVVYDEETGRELERIPNTDKLRWHEQASKDLMAHAIIAGAKAPSRVEVSATSAELNQMVQVMLTQVGDDQLAIEADIWDAEEIPDEADPMGD
jgi:hypothetical protein